jgi:hypothetical protein
MPPKSKLSSIEIDTLKRWIDEGAVWPDGVDVAKVEDKTRLVELQAAPSSSFKLQVSSSSPSDAAGNLETPSMITSSARSSPKSQPQPAPESRHAAL